jgi:hypothetical protein
MAKVHNARKSLLTRASRPAVLLCPAEGTKDAFKVIYLDTNSVAHSRDLVHFDNDFPFNRADAPSATSLVPPELLAAPPAVPPGSRLSTQLLSNNPYSVLEVQEEQSAAASRPRRVVAHPAPVYVPGAFEAQREHDRRHVNVAVAAPTPAAALLAEEEPRTLREALARDDHAAWLDAVRSELSSHRKNGTWTPSTVPSGHIAIPSRWVFKLKRGPSGEVIKYKARLVAKGFKQRAGIDFTETFSPTLRTSTFRLLCALSCQFDLHLHQMDVSTAFLVPALREEMYLRLPEQPLVDQHLPTFGSPPLVRLNKTLYGLVQSPREFYLHFSGVLAGMGFQQSAIIWTPACGFV